MHCSHNELFKALKNSIQDTEPHIIYDYVNYRKQCFISYKIQPFVQIFQFIEKYTIIDQCYPLNVYHSKT